MRQAFAFWLRHRAEGIWLVLVIAVATAVATTVWSIAASVWFDRLPYSDPDRLVSLGWTDDSPGRMPQTSVDEFEDLKRTTGELFDLAAWENDLPWFLRLGDEPVEIIGAPATTNIFDVLGVQPSMGRTFRADDANANGTVAVISNRLWVSAFNRDPSVIGRSVVVEVGAQYIDRVIQIVGVLPARGAVRRLSAREVDLMVAVPDGVRPDRPSSRRAPVRVLIARLKPGITPETAESRTTSVFREIDRTTGLFVRTRTASIIGLQEHWFGRTKPFLLLLGAAAAFLLLVAAANGAGVMLALGSRRVREIAVRTAIGAGRGHLVAQALRESAVIAIAAAGLSIVAAAAMLRIFVAWGPASVPRLAEASLDWTAVLFAAAVAAVFCMILGVVPAYARRQRDVLSVLQSGGATSTASRRTLRVRQFAIAVQLAVVLALLAAAGLVSSTLWRMLSQPLGFDPERIVIAEITPTRPYWRDPPRYQRVMDDARRAVEAVPGVTGAALALDPPLADDASTMRSRVRFLDQPSTFIATKMVSSGFFSVMKIPLLAGRDFQTGGSVTGDSAIVNEMFARTYFGGVEQALGREFDFDTRRRVVGVVGNVREEGVTVALKPILYPELAGGRWTLIKFHVVVRHRGAEAAVLRDVEAAILRADPSSHVNVLPLNDRLRAQTAVARTQSAAIGLIAICALLLAGLGIYATIAQVVEDRQREMAIRSALGASGRALIALAAGGVGVAAIAGVAGGGLLSWIVARVTRQFLFEMSPFDPVVWISAAVLLVGTAVAAAWWPARRAASVDPAVVLKQS